MTTHHTPDPERVGLTDLAKAEKRRRIAEIVWLIANARHRIPDIEVELAKEATPRRQKADLKLEIATVGFEVAQLRHESDLLKDDLATDKERFP